MMPKRLPTYSAQLKMMMDEMPKFNHEDFQDWFFNESAYTIMGGTHLVAYFDYLKTKNGNKF